MPLPTRVTRVTLLHLFLIKQLRIVTGIRASQRVSNLLKNASKRGKRLVSLLFKSSNAKLWPGCAPRLIENLCLNILNE